MSKEQLEPKASPRLTTYGTIRTADGCAYVWCLDRQRSSGSCIELRGNQPDEAANERAILRLVRKMHGEMDRRIKTGVRKRWRTL